MDYIKENSRRELMEEIMAYNFRLTELALYLDTHPEDKRALALHNESAKVCRDLQEKYQRAYGPLTNEYPCNKWRWIEEPWPWEGGNY